MASPHELSGGEFSSPYSTDVRARNTGIGDHYHVERAKEFTKHLEELAATYPNLINPEQIALAAEREGQAAGEAALVQRESGLMNDERSKRPGIFVTGHMDYEAIAAMKEQFDIDRVDYRLETLDDRFPYTPYALYLPTGAFSCEVEGFEPEEVERRLRDQRHLRLFGAVEFGLEDGADFRPVGGGAHYVTGAYLPGGQRLAHGTVNRIEGAGGTLWQNPKANPDSPRAGA